MRSNRTSKTLAGLAGLALLLGPFSACGIVGGKDKPEASISDLSGGDNTTVTLDADFAAALESLGVTPGAFGTAELADGAISFPITGGNVAIYEKDAVNRYVQGQVQHEGSGLSLEAGGTEVVVGNFNVDPTASLVYGDVAVDKAVQATSIPIFRLDGRSLKEPDLGGDTVVLEGSKVYLTDAAADLLNTTFGIEDLNGDLLIGIAKITANVP